MGFAESLQLVDPWIYQLISAASSWEGVVSGAGESIQIGRPHLTSTWTSGGSSVTYHYYDVRDPHEGFWVGATANISGSATSEAYVASVLVLDYPIVLPARFESLYGLLGSPDLVITSDTLTCDMTISAGYWPSSRLHNSTNLYIYVKYLGLYETPYTDPSSSSWFSPTALESLPTLSGPLDAYSIRTQNAIIRELYSDTYCESNLVYRSRVVLPYFIPFTNDATTNAILADLDNANAGPTNTRYAKNVRFLRLLLVSNHLVDNTPPTGDETFLAATTYEDFGRTLCGFSQTSFPPRLMGASNGVTQIFAIDAPPTHSPAPVVEAQIYEAPSGSNHAAVLLDRGGYVVDTTTRLAMEELSYSEARSFVEGFSYSTRPTWGTAAPYGDSLVSPLDSRDMETPAEPSAIIGTSDGASAAFGALHWAPESGGLLLQPGWSHRDYSGGEGVPNSSYFSAYPSLGVALGDGGSTYSLYPAPDFRLTRPTGGMVALGLGIDVDDEGVIFVVANGALVWG